MPAICSIEAEVCSRLAACSSVRCDRSVVLVDISADALVTSAADDLISAMVEPIRSAIVLELSLSCAEHALVVSFNSFGQIAIGKRAQHADEVLHCPGGVLAQRVHRAGEIEHEPALAIDRHALREIAGDHRFDQIVDLGLDRLLDRLVLPLDDRAGAFAVLVNDRRSDMLEFKAANRNVGFAGSGQRVHQLALMRNILVEHVHVDADELLAVKIR